MKFAKMINIMLKAKNYNEKQIFKEVNEIIIIRVNLQYLAFN